MNSPAELRPRLSPDTRFVVREAIIKQWQLNRFLYEFVGHDWSWRDKSTWTEKQWQDYAESERMRTFTACYDGSLGGYFEMRPDTQGGIEIAMLGLAPKFIGRGFGAALLTQALVNAWDTKPVRVWLHTCTLDHPSALANYQARGMKIYKTEKVKVPDSD